MGKYNSTPGHLMEGMRITLCQQKRRRPAFTQGELKEWLWTTHGVCITQATINLTKKRSDELLAMAADTSVMPPRLTLRTRQVVQYPQMELALKHWILEQQDKVNLNGDMLCAKVARFLQELHLDAQEMAFSQGWLEKFKDRHGIKPFCYFGESGALDMEAVGAAPPDIRVVVDAYAKKDVFNMDETGLCWRLQADNSLATHQLEGQKINKECITLVICTNSDSNEKIPLTIIGKHLNPCCFKGINRDTLGAHYHANAKAWMTQNVFRLWLLDFDHQMQGHQVLLLLDNCPGHIPLEKFAEMNVVLRNTRVSYLPPNMTSAVQPCDVGIIRTFKAYYRKRFNNLLLDGYENNIDNLENMSILDVFRLAIPAWVEDVSLATIANCFRHCKIWTNDIIHTQQGEVGPPTALIQEL